MPSYLNLWLKTTTNSTNIGPLCTINTAAPLLESRTRHTITPTNTQRPKQTP